MRVCNSSDRPGSIRCNQKAGGSALGWQEAPALRFGEPAPDAVRFPGTQCELETLVLDGAIPADLLRFGLARFALLAPFRKRRWEEQRGLRPPARCLQVPRLMHYSECHTQDVSPRSTSIARGTVSPVCTWDKLPGQRWR